MSFYLSFLTHCRDRGERIALKWREQEISYHELGQYVASVQHFLLSNVPPETPILLYGDSHPYLYAAIIASLFTGYPYVPLNPNFPPRRNEVIAENFPNSPLLYVGEPSFRNGVSLALIIESERWKKPILPPQTSSGLAYVLFTSGSTGTPKGVCISHENLNAFLSNFFSLFSFSPNERVLQMFDFTFDLSIFSFLVPLLIGASFYPTDSSGFKYLQIPELIENEDITVAMMVPSVIAFLNQYTEEFSFPSLKYNFFCGEPLSHTLLSRWAKACPNATFHNVYGPTEATLFCSHYQWNGDESLVYQDVVSIGKPLGTTLFVLRSLENGSFLHEPYQRGELIIVGDQVGKGYLHQPQLTEKVFFQYEHLPAYATGDLAFFDENGYFYFLGRIDDQVKIQGYRIELQEIIAQIHNLLPEPRNVVILVQEEEQQQTLYGVIEGEPCMDPSSLLQKLSEILPPYMVPKKIHYMNQFPLNVNGKVDKKMLKSILFEQMAN